MFILAGPNGAGKSTLYETVVRPRLAAPFINADLIQRDELRDGSMTAAYRAADIAERRRRDLLQRRRSFVSESTFSHESKLALVHEARTAGFRVVMFHVSVEQARLSVARVAQRVTEGGHDVPEAKILERFERNQPLIRSAVLMADQAYVYDNSRLNVAPKRCIAFRNGEVVDVSDPVPQWAASLYQAELLKIHPDHGAPDSQD
jgi:predicted ABC-type ATPase